MNTKELTWKEESRKKVFDSRVFSVYESYCKSPHDELGTFTILDAADWAIIVPVVQTAEGKKFVMVRQWRHGSQTMSLEFPGGVFEPGENPQDAAVRELREETGYKPGSIRKLGEFSPNPAIMANKVHFFLAEDLAAGSQNLDADEFVAVELVSIEAVNKGMGKPPYIHALMGSALALYLQQQR
ncbi:MAG: NUDIX hydrolase [Treponema sp.]|jgi:8-oxo-dGTP pyrophosphatase MutT (NUDIX family)|nr:NUDIX hydrolase [Treponema sp.]